VIALLTAIAIDGKWLRGAADGQVRLFAAMLQEDKTVIGQHRIPDGPTETTQVRALLDSVDPAGTVAIAHAAHAQRQTAQYIAGPDEEDCQGADHFLSPAASTSRRPGRQCASAATSTTATGSLPARKQCTAPPALTECRR
jgi:hypothetical protein